MSKLMPVYGPRFKSKLDLMGIRFLEEGGDGSGAGGDDAAAVAAAAKTAADALGDAGQQAIDRMKAERNTARDEAKAFKALGMSAEDIAAIIAEKNAGKPVDEEAIEKRLRTQISAEAKEKSAAKFRASNVREQAATLGFTAPKDALALLDHAELEKIEVDDDDEVDSAAVKKLLEKLATDKPYLLKPTDNTPGHQAAGIGASGSGSKPDVQPGLPRMRDAYENSSKK